MPYKDVIKQRSAVRRSMSKWRIAIKPKLVKMLGGKCSLCGYDKYIGALEFHHLNRSEKKFKLSEVMRNQKSWPLILEEVKKCVLLCSNCHKEVEAGISMVVIV